MSGRLMLASSILFVAFLLCFFLNRFIIFRLYFSIRIVTFILFHSIHINIMNVVLYLKVNYVKLKMYSMNILHRCISILNWCCGRRCHRDSHRRNVQFFCFFFFYVVNINGFGRFIHTSGSSVNFVVVYILDNSLQQHCTLDRHRKTGKLTN